MLGVSRQTLYRRLDEFDIPSCDFSSISSNDLDRTVSEIKESFPNDGEVMLQGHMLRLGIKVSRSDLRDSIHRVDHENTVARRSNVITRRIYSVSHPNAVWHIDGNHKLIHWRFVIHAGVDGFSRMIMFVKCANNNRAATVLETFLGAVSLFGLPNSVRTDHGGENDVWRYMLYANNSNPSCVITGSSTHNERVERMWRDIYRSVSSSFASTFASLEHDGVLDPLNETDMYCLQYIFLPRINRCLNEFKESWNMHSLSTEGNMSPCQLFMEGISTVQSDNRIPDVNPGQSTTFNEADRVRVPSRSFEPCNVLLAQIHLIDPRSSSPDFGKTLYHQVLQLVGCHLQSSCSFCRVND